MKSSCVLALCLYCLAAGAADLEVRLSGVDDEIEANVRASLGLFELAERGDVDAYTAQFYLDRAEAEVRTALEPFGYYTPNVQTRLESGTPLVAHVDIDKGRAVRVRSVSVRLLRNGEPAAYDFTLPQFPLTPGERLDHQRYEAGKKAIRNALFDEGYVDAQPVVHEVRVRPEQRNATIELAWELNQLHHFGEINFEGGQFDPDFMRRFMPFEQGDVFAQYKLLELTQRLRDSRYFDHVRVTPDLERDEPVIPVTISLSPIARDLYEIGFVYGTDSGPGIELDFNRRWVNRRGHRASLSLDLAQRRQLVGATYDVPSGDAFDSFYQVAATISEEETDSSTSETTRVSVSRFRPWGAWRRVDALTFLDERSIIADEVTDSYFLLPGVTLSRVESNGEIIPDYGWSLRGTTRGALEHVLSDASLLQLDVTAKWISSFGEDWRLLTGVRAGTTLTSDFDALPASLRFFAGGDRTIRGFDFESLGPENEDGEVIGGKHLIVGSLEVERVVTGPWRAAAFIDAGNAFSQFGEEGEEVEVGIGIGARYASPVGLIRADIGVPLTDDDQGLRLHLRVGPDL